MRTLAMFDEPECLRRDLPDAVLEFYPRFLHAAEAQAAFDALAAPGAIAWRQDRIRMYGREVPVPRLNAWYGESRDYAYSGIAMSPLPWTPVLRRLRERVEDRTGCEFSNVLVNLYRDGSDSVAWHSDDEPELGPDPVIASLSLGATRDFHLRHRGYRKNGLPVQCVELHGGSLLVMRGATQRHWQHQVPKRRGAQARGRRINLTFRWLVSRSPR